MAIHLRPPVTRRLLRPTRGLGSAPLPRRVAPHGLRPPIWPCSGWSLPRFTPSSACAEAGIVTVALVLVSRRTGVTRHPALRSSDVPHAVTGLPPTGARPSDRLAESVILRWRPKPAALRRARAGWRRVDRHADLARPDLEDKLGGGPAQDEVAVGIHVRNRHSLKTVEVCRFDIVASCLEAGTHRREEAGHGQRAGRRLVRELSPEGVATAVARESVSVELEGEVRARRRGAALDAPHAPRHSMQGCWI